jgi:hypothetical protein
LDTSISSARRDNPNLRDALADELFREIQQRRTPELLTVEWIELFRYLSPQLRARRRGQTGSLSYTIICEEDSEMEAPPLVPNNVVELVPSPSSSLRTTR